MTRQRNRLGIGLFLWAIADPANGLAKAPAGASLVPNVDACTQDAACHALSEQGLQKYQSGDYRSALARYQAAYAKYPLARLLYNIGRTQHQLGRNAEAEQAYRNFLVQTSDDVLRAKAQEYLAQLEQERPPQQSPPRPELAPTVILAPTSLSEPHTALPEQRPTSTSDGTRVVPVYKKWWFWTAVGGGVVAITAIGLGIGLSQRTPSIPADPNTLSFPQ